jgi:hypothetical protein
MGNDTVPVHPAIVPVNGEEPTASQPTTKSPSNLPMTMQSSHIPNDRDNCGVPWSSTYSPERARMGNDTVPVYLAIVPVNGEEPTAS